MSLSSPSSSFRIGLISDTHIPEARIDLWPQVFHAFAGCDAILHGGDVYDLNIIDQLNDIAPIWVARGNGDDGSGGRPITPDDHRLQEAWTLELGGITIGLTHAFPAPETSWWKLPAACERFFGGVTPDVVIHGDTHVEDIREIEGVLCVNPGSPTFPHNLACQLGTIGFLDIVGGQASASIWQLSDDGHEPFDWTKWKRPW